MIELLAIPLAIALVVLIALITLLKTRSRFSEHTIFYRVSFCALLALLCPTLLIAGHGVIPLPTISGAAVMVINLSSFEDFRASLIAISTKDAAILIAPSIILFSLSLALYCTTFKHRLPSIPPSSGD